MTKSREAKRETEMHLKGLATREHLSPQGRRMCRETGRGHYRMTPAEYRERIMLRRTVSAETATAVKMERMGWKMIGGVGFRKHTRVA